MSGGTACTNRAHRPSWRVTQRKRNHSAFNGGRMTPSAYSEVTCGTCERRWRTKATYVDQLPDGAAAMNELTGEKSQVLCPERDWDSDLVGFSYCVLPPGHDGDHDFRYDNAKSVD